MEDAGRATMRRVVREWGDELARGGVGLFYYAGHGVQVQGKNYLIPVDAEIESEAAVRTEAVDVDQLLHQLGPARLSMVILDACRNNPFERRFRGTGGGLAQIDAPTGTLLAYATAQVSAIPGVRVIGTAKHKAAVLSFEVKGVHPHDVGT